MDRHFYFFLKQIIYLKYIKIFLIICDFINILKNFQFKKIYKANFYQ